MRTATLRVLCEGQTERNFVIQVLSSHLRDRNVYVKAESLTPRGFGTVSFDKLYSAIKRDIGRSRGHEFVTTMIDLYALHNFPGVDRVIGEPSYQRVVRIERRMFDEIPSKQFIPYVQLHEFEALVLVDVDQLPLQFPDGEAASAPTELRRLIAGTSPEEVNDGVETAPSKRIISIVPAYSAVKAIAGPAIANAIGLPTLRKACPHFNEWLTRLETLAELP